MITIVDIEDNKKIMSDEELEIFFNKYDIAELEMLFNIFEYVKEKDLLNTRKIAEKVYYEKMKNINDYYEISRYSDFDIPKVLYKVGLLTDKELIFLKSLVEDADFYLSSVIEFPYENIIEDFKEDDYNIDMTVKFEEPIKDKRDKFMEYLREAVEEGHTEQGKYVTSKPKTQEKQEENDTQKGQEDLSERN